MRWLLAGTALAALAVLAACWATALVIAEPCVLG
jgi:hypothetical protein